METTPSKSRSSLQIGKKAFLSAAFILLFLMVTAGVLTRVVPSGAYERSIEQGRELVVADSYREVEVEPPAVWRWFTAPIEVLWGSDSLTINTIILLLVLISGAFHILESGGILKSVLSMLVQRFQGKKYLLMAMVIFFFMFTASVLGIYEGMVPMVVIVVPLAFALGWDSLTGLGMSLLAMAFGFSAAVTNPFTIGVAQKIAGLPLFSGAWLRVIFFITVYITVFLFVRNHARKVERDPSRSPLFEEEGSLRAEYAMENLAAAFRTDVLPLQLKRSIIWVAAWIGGAIVFVLVSSQIDAVSFLAFPVMGLFFFIAGIGGGFFTGMRFRRIASVFLQGTVSILPAILLILMAMSVKHIITLGGIMDTILFHASEVISGTGPFAAGILIYLLTMVLNFFVASASAKAFLMMPILAPLSDLVGLTRQTAVLAFDFGDGFSNMLYPSNALLLIALGFTVVSYPRWLRWTLPVQGLMLLFSVLFIFIAVQIGFGPF
jgi:uncharacterized ion transporter superfamily protein YfcC